MLVIKEISKIIILLFVTRVIATFCLGQGNIIYGLTAITSSSHGVSKVWIHASVNEESPRFPSLLNKHVHIGQ